MEWWKIGLFVSNILTMLITTTAFIVIKFNDLTHLSRTVKDLKEVLNKYQEEVKNMAKDIVEIQTRCEERHER